MVHKHVAIVERCKICDNKNLQYMFETNKCTIAKCLQCGLVQVVNLKDIPLYEYKKDYFINSKYKDKKTQNLELARRKKILSQYCERGGRVLDAGCATGEFAHFISDVYKVSGCDISEDAIKVAKNTYTDMDNCFWCGTVEQIADRNEQYDAICMWDVIEHVPEPLEVITGMLKHITADGCMIISTPNIGALFAKIMRSKWPFMTPPEHLCFFSKKSFEKMFDQLGVKMVYWSTRGKWVNAGFILYKFNRVSNLKVPEKIIQLFQNTWLAKWYVYVPTFDVQYLVVKKSAEK